MTLSRTRLYGAMMWAFALTSSLQVSTPRASRPSSSSKRTARSTTTPLPMTGVQVGVRMPDGQQVQRVLLALAVLLDDDGVAGVVAPVELHDVVDVAAEQVGGLALALVAPLGAHEHDCRHTRTSPITRLDQAVMQQAPCVRTGPVLVKATGPGSSRGSETTRASREPELEPGLHAVPSHQPGHPAPHGPQAAPEVAGDGLVLEPEAEQPEHRWSSSSLRRPA